MKTHRTTNQANFCSLEVLRADKGAPNKYGGVVVSHLAKNGMMVSFTLPRLGPSYV
jgi:hypothetical protein